MNNLSSSRIEEKKEFIELEEIQEKPKIDVQSIITQCNIFLSSLESTYNIRSIKELHDSIIHVSSAKRCLENINLN